MAGSRGPTPLFEVLAGHGENRPPPSSRDASGRGPDERPSERPERSGGGGGGGGASRLSVPLPTIYASFAVVLLLCLLCFLVGYQSGYGRAEGELAGLGPMDVVPLDPLSEDGGLDLPAPAPRTQPGGNTGTGTPTRPGGASDAGRGPAPESRPGTDPGANWVLGLDGVRTVDPRVEGNNYLELVTLSQAQAEEAIAYLDGNGVSAIGVPVDRGARGTNNPARYRIVTLELAIPSGRFSELDGDRRRLEQRLRGLGRAWVAEGGWSDFRDPLWRRYDP